MVIENLSILDYFKFKNKIEDCSKDTSRFFGIFKLCNLKKLTYNGEIIMLLFYGRLSFNTIELKKSILINKDFLKKSTMYDITNKNNKTLLFITDDPVLAGYIKNKKQSNLILKSYIKDMNLQYDDIEVEIFNKRENIKIRCELQNSIFFDTSRVPLQERDILYECEKNNYIPELAYLLKKNDQYIGYGQILLIDDKYYVVNFGVVEEYRRKGYGKKFLNVLLIKAQSYGLDEIYIKVDKSNQVALDLYTKLGFRFFKEINIFEID